MAEEHVLRITHLRDCLGWAYQQVALTGEPIIIQRYSRKDAVIVPFEEWQFFKQLEADIRAGRCPWEEPSK
jgi:hypothetical protein